MEQNAVYKKIIDLVNGDQVYNDGGNFAYQIISNNKGLLYVYDYKKREFYDINWCRFAKNNAIVRVAK